MESLRVKMLRELHGIGDCRNEYTEKEIADILQSKAFYFAYKIDEYDGSVDYIEKEVLAYISKDNCIWMKDKELNDGKICYMPEKRIDYCCHKLDSEIYHYNNMYCYNVYFCFDKNIDVCRSVVKQDITTELKNMIKEQELKLRILNQSLNSLSLTNTEQTQEIENEYS